MSYYCAECGIHYQTDDSSCAKCGSMLVEEQEREYTGESNAGDAALLNKASAIEGMRPDRDMDCQLGKGLIKPNAVEMDIDGFHFKYDKPARNIFKAGNSSDKVAEFRVTCPEPESVISPEETPAVEIAPEETLLEAAAPEVPPDIKNDESIEIITSEVAEPVLVEEPETSETGNAVIESVESDDQPLGEEEWLKGDIITDEVFEPQIENENFNLPEPELGTPKETETLWEDSERWFGIPIANQYRISGRTLQIINRLARKFSELDLTLISEVKLKQSWFDKLLGTGDLLISVKHLPETGLTLAGVRKPENVRRLLEELINSME